MALFSRPAIKLGISDGLDYHRVLAAISGRSFSSDTQSILLYQLSGPLLYQLSHPLLS